MQRMVRRHPWRFGIGAVFLASCARQPAPPSHVDAGDGSASGTASAIAPFASAKPLAPASDAETRRAPRCAPLNAGEISDDETPAIRGVSKSSELLPWLEVRGVSKRAALSFLAGYYGRGIDLASAETYFSQTCFEVDVGDKPEPALLCAHGLPDGLVATRAVAIVVRNKRPAVVLDLGLNVIALDWPDARWLDLALEIKDSGRVIELHDRAPDETRIVAPPSACVARQAVLDQCEKDFAKEPTPESFVERAPNGSEMFRFFHGQCPIERGPDKELVVSRRPLDQAFGAYPATVHDCAGGRAALLRAQSDATAGSDRADWRRSLALLDRSCGQRGAWVWQGERFAKQR